MFSPLWKVFSEISKCCLFTGYQTPVFSVEELSPFSTVSILVLESSPSNIPFSQLKFESLSTIAFLTEYLRLASEAST
ncbi:hypothetical protein HRED_03005 [Candidatus Haloredivivus sp. G17]|nr:hypothetical protein HRED_03005 [Candidatus Haloredivivus sp. G17]